MTANLGYNELVKKCGRCGGNLRRIHRTFWERLSYVAKYRCKNCRSTEAVPVPYRFHLGQFCRCHRCGTFRVRRLKTRDRIDPMERGLLNKLEKLAHGKLYHCKFCRIQFWDRRELEPKVAAAMRITPAPPKRTEAQSYFVEGAAQP